MIKKWQPRRVCYSKHYATTLQDKEVATAKNIGDERSYPRGHHIEQQDQSSAEGSPAGNLNHVVGKKRKSPNNKLIQNKRRKQVIQKYALWQRPTFWTSSLQSPMLTSVRSQPKWGPVDVHWAVATEPAEMTYQVVTLSQVPMRKAWSMKILLTVSAQQGVHGTSNAKYNLCVQHAWKQGSGLKFTVIGCI